MQITKRRVFSSIVCLSITVVAVLIFSINKSIQEPTVLPVNDIAKVMGCTIQNNRCEFNVDQQKFDVIFVEKPVPEEEVRFSISSNEDFNIENAWIEGIDMYMGKSPVIPELVEPSRLQAVFFLGSCNLRTMEWRMMLKFKQKTHPIEVRFTTTSR